MASGVGSLSEPLLRSEQQQKSNAEPTIGSSCGNVLGLAAQPLALLQLPEPQNSDAQSLNEELQSQEQAVDSLRRDAQDQTVLITKLERLVYKQDEALVQMKDFQAAHREVAVLGSQLEQKISEVNSLSSRVAAEERILQSLGPANRSCSWEKTQHQVFSPPGPGLSTGVQEEREVRVLFNQSPDSESDDTVQEHESVAVLDNLREADDGEVEERVGFVLTQSTGSRRDMVSQVLVVVASCILAVVAVLLKLPPKNIDECSCASMTFSTLIACMGGVVIGFLIGRQSQPGLSEHVEKVSSINTVNTVLTSRSVLSSRSVLAPLVITRSAGTQTNIKNGITRTSVLDGLLGIQRQGLDELGMLGEYLNYEDMQEDSHHESERHAADDAHHEIMRSERSMKTCVVKAFRSGKVCDVFEELNWNSDIGMLGGSSKQPLLIMGLHLMDKCDLLNSIPDWMLEDNLTKQVLSDRILAFLHEVGLQYTAGVPYHNSLHACDVMKNVYCLFETGFYRLLMESREWTELISVLAAAIHDMGHPGTTNNFIISTKSDLALRYNDKSPLEQMHVSKAFELMRDLPRTDWFNVFRKERMIEKKGKAMPIQNRFRRTLIAMVLATDNLKHNDHVLQLREFVDAGNVEERILGSGSDSNEMRQFALETLLHAADIANCTYELPLTISWTQRLLNEFWAQGDLEKETFGAATMPMFDRNKMDVPGTQIGFIRFIANGLWEPLVSLLPEFDDQLLQMQNNIVFWEKRKAQGLCGIPSDDEIQSAHRQQKDEMESNDASKNS